MLRDEALLAADAVVLNTNGISARRSCDFIRSVRRGHRRVAIVAVCSTSNGHYNGVAAMRGAGASQVLFVEENAFWNKLRDTICTCRPARETSEDLAVLLGLPALAQDLIEAAGYGTGTRTSIQAAAAKLRMPRRTLYERMCRECGMAPARLLAWAMTVRLVRTLECTTWTFAAAAEETGYGTAWAARRHLRVLGNMSVKESRTAGALESLLERFRVGMLRGPGASAT